MDIFKEISQGNLSEKDILKGFQFCPRCLESSLKKGLRYTIGTTKDIYQDLLGLINSGCDREDLVKYFSYERENKRLQLIEDAFG
jgi:hypothetical protein